MVKVVNQASSKTHRFKNAVQIGNGILSYQCGLRSRCIGENSSTKRYQRKRIRWKRAQSWTQERANPLNAYVKLLKLYIKRLLDRMQSGQIIIWTSTDSCNLVVSVWRRWNCVQLHEMKRNAKWSMKTKNSCFKFSLKYPGDIRFL